MRPAVRLGIGQGEKVTEHKDLGLSLSVLPGQSPLGWQLWAEVVNSFKVWEPKGKEVGTSRLASLSHGVGNKSHIPNALKERVRSMPRALGKTI